MRFEALSAENWNAFEQLFGKKGACGGCWCMNWRLTAAEFENGKGESNKQALKKRVEQGDFVGIIALTNEKAVAWCSIAPRETFPRLEKSKIFSPLDDRKVWSISCLYLDQSVRGQGFAAELIKEAVKEAIHRGAQAIEAYPFDANDKKLPAPFVWTGISSSYYKAGFTEAARRSANRPVLRLTKK